MDVAPPVLSHPDSDGIRHILFPDLDAKSWPTWFPYEKDIVALGQSFVLVVDTDNKAEPFTLKKGHRLVHNHPRITGSSEPWDVDLAKLKSYASKDDVLKILGNKSPYGSGSGARTSRPEVDNRDVDPRRRSSGPEKAVSTLKVEQSGQKDGGASPAGSAGSEIWPEETREELADGFIYVKKGSRFCLISQPSVAASRLSGRLREIKKGKQPVNSGSGNPSPQQIPPSNKGDIEAVSGDKAEDAVVVTSGSEDSDDSSAPILQNTLRMLERGLVLQNLNGKLDYVHDPELAALVLSSKKGQLKSGNGSSKEVRVKVEKSDPGKALKDSDKKTTAPSKTPDKKDATSTKKIQPSTANQGTVPWIPKTVPGDKAGFTTAGKAGPKAAEPGRGDKSKTSTSRTRRPAAGIALGGFGDSRSVLATQPSGPTTGSVLRLELEAKIKEKDELIRKLTVSFPVF